MQALLLLCFVMIEYSYSITSRVSIKVKEDYNSICQISRFMIENTYNNVPHYQLNKIIQQNNDNLYDHYGERVGRKNNPSRLLVAYINKSIVGCIGIHSTIFDKSIKRYELINPSSRSTIPNENDVFPMMSNLVVSKHHRRKGIAKLLLKEIEDYIQSESYSKILLVVDDENKAAHELYLSNGYKINLRKYKTTKIVYDNKLEHVITNNYIMSKKIF
jgi:ribosomal protein S18 acetylase RimI-like enzyme